MKELIAKNPKQLDLCLKLLYAENVRFVVRVFETNKQKIMYAVTVKVNGEKLRQLEEKYRILIS